MTLLDEIRLELGESTSMLGTYFWSTTEVCNAANAALIAAYIDVNEDTAIGTMTTTASTTDTTLPYNTVMIPKRIVGMKGEVFPISITDLEIYKADWGIIGGAGTPAAPRWIAPDGYEAVSLWPVPDTAYEYDIYGVAWPGEISGGSPDITLDRELKEAVVCLTVAFLIDDYYTELCEIKYREYLQHINAYARILRNRRGRAPVQLKPSSSFDRARSGSISLGRQFRGI